MSNISTLSSLNRISGLASGLDTDTLVKQLIQVDSIPLDKLYQQKQLLQWKQTDYRDLNSKVLALRNEIFNMKLEGTYKKYDASSSNEAVVTASANATASATSYVFNEITSLAKASSIATADGQNISRSTSVITGTNISASINTDTNNTFKINYNGLGFVDVTLDAGKVYDNITPGGLYTDLVKDIQTKLDAALATQSVAAGTVKVSLTRNNNIQFTTNDPLNGPPNSIVLQEGDSNDVLETGFGFVTDSTTKQISSTVQKVDLDQTLYTNLLQDRFKNTEDFGWIVNGSDSQTLGAATDNLVSTVDYNGTNVSNYHVYVNESQTSSISGGPASTFVSSVNYNANSAANTFVYVGGTKYTVVVGKEVDDMQSSEVLVSDDGTGKLKLTFKSELADGTSIKIDTNTKFSAVTGKIQAELSSGEVLVENDGTGKAKFTFRNQLNAGTKVSIDRHDFTFSLTTYNQSEAAATTDFTIDAFTESMNNVISKISSNTTVGFSPFYDSATDKIILNASKTGNNNPTGDDISVTGNFLSGALQMTKYTEGSDAAFTINNLTTTRKDNSFTINGVSFTLKSTTLAANPVTVSVSQNVDDVFDAIKAFVDKYNETIDSINTKLTEKRYRDYQPLTSTQKDAMKDSDIEKWEEKAKSGLLNADTILGSFVDKMRKSLYDKVASATDSKYNQLAQIGITSSSLYQDRGKLIINESKLREAIAQAPDKIMQMFTNTSTAADKSQNYNESGIAVRLYNDATNVMASLSDKAGIDGSFTLYDNSIIGKELSKLEVRIEDMQIRLINKEDSYYRKFTALETAINRMNAQSAWLSQQLGGGQ